MRSQFLVLEFRNLQKRLYYLVFGRAEHRALRYPLIIRRIQEMTGIILYSMTERPNDERQPVVIHGNSGTENAKI